MFTGIVQTKAIVISTNTENQLCRLVVSVEKAFAQQLALGASIAINGVCLTVVQYFTEDNNSIIHFDVIDETLKLTNLGNLIEGSVINFERSLKFGDELGGHIVSGHIQTTASLVELAQTNENCTMKFAIDKTFSKYILPKGFISVNGISLTVGEAGEDFFYVHLIPETLMRTNLSELKLADKVNIELDQQTITIVTTVERLGLKLAD